MMVEWRGCGETYYAVDGQPCAGTLHVVAATGAVWTAECDRCGYETGIRPRDLSPSFVEQVRASRSTAEVDRELRERRRDVERRRHASGIPSALRAITWTDVRDHPPNPLEAARRWGSGETRGLLLCGPVGVGKTWLAAAAANARLERDSLRWFSAPSLLAQLGRDFKDERLAAVVDDVIEPTGALVLDDIDKARATEYATEKLWLAIDARITSEQPLLVTSNLMPTAIAKRFRSGDVDGWGAGDSIVSRLRGYCEAFLIEGADRRLAGIAA